MVTKEDFTITDEQGHLIVAGGNFVQTVDWRTNSPITTRKQAKEIIDLLVEIINTANEPVQETETLEDRFRRLEEQITQNQIALTELFEMTSL